jgi:hypothetical protein
VLALVFVDPLHLHVEQGARIHQDAGVAVDVMAELPFHRQLGGLPALQEAAVIHKLLEFAQVIELVDPALPDRFIQQRRQLGIGQADPAPGGDAVGDVGELLGPQGREFREQLGFDQFAVQGCHAIDVVGCHGGEVGHAHGLAALLVDDRHLAQDLFVPWVLETHLLEETAVDLVDQLQMPG